MDSTINASNSSATNGQKNDVEEEKDSIGSKRAQFCATYRHQNFALPDSIMYYIAMKPATSKGYQKLIKTCKYFFIKNPMYFQSYQIWDGHKWNLNGKKQDLDLANSILFSYFKHWVAGRFCCASKNDNTPKIISFLIPKFNQSNLKCLHLQFQDITFADYTILSSSAEEIWLNNVTVKYENGNITELEKLVEAATKVYRFTISSKTTLTNITSNTAKELVKLPHFSKLQFFSIEKIHDTFDIDEFFAFIKKIRYMKLELYFDAAISDAYENRLNAIIDELLAASLRKQCPHYPPLLTFPGMDAKKYNDITRLYYTFFSGEY